MKSSDFYNAGLFVLICGLGFALIDYLNKVISLFPFFLIVLAIILFVMANIFANKEKDGRHTDYELDSKQLNWNEIFTYVSQKLGVRSARDMLQNATVHIDDIKPVGKQFDFRWNGYQKFLPLVSFELHEAENWRLYYSAEQKVAFLFVHDMVSSPFCFVNDTAEHYFA